MTVVEKLEAQIAALEAVARAHLRERDAFRTKIAVLEAKLRSEAKARVRRRTVPDQGRAA